MLQRSETVGDVNVPTGWYLPGLLSPEDVVPLDPAEEAEAEALTGDRLRELFRESRALHAKSASRHARALTRTQQIREWARKTGLPVKEHGRIASEIVARYEATMRTAV